MSTQLNDAEMEIVCLEYFFQKFETKKRGQLNVGIEILTQYLDWHVYGMTGTMTKSS